MGKTLTIKPKSKPRSNRKSSRRSGFRENVKLLFAAIVIAVLVKVLLIHAYRVPSRSMEDTLFVGDFLLAEKVSFGAPLPLGGLRLPAVSSPIPGDVVLFNYPLEPETAYVKRCVAVAGQVVEIRDKVLYVDGDRVRDPPYSKFLDARIYRGFENPRDNTVPLTVPDGYVFVMGDNRDNSRDSRHWGMLPLELIFGRVICVYWSCRLRTDLDTHMRERALFDTLASIVERIRWERVGLLVR